MAAHPLKDVINAYGDGRTIQFFAHGKWVDELSPAFSAQSNPARWRIKPAEPAVEYPVTRMTPGELIDSWNAAPNRREFGAILNSLANDVLRHAIDSQQVVRMAEVQEIASQLGKDKRAARDMAVAEAVKSSLKIVSVEHGIEMGFPDLATVIAGVK